VNKEVFSVILQYPLDTLETGSDLVELFCHRTKAVDAKEAVKHARRTASRRNDGDIKGKDFLVLFVFKGDVFLQEILYREED